MDTGWALGGEAGCIWGEKSGDTEERDDWEWDLDSELVIDGTIGGETAG